MISQKSYFHIFSAFAAADKNGGGLCAACGILTSWIEQYADAKGKDGFEATRDIVGFLPVDIDIIGGIAEEIFGRMVNDIQRNPTWHTVDTMCYCIGACYVSEDHKTCAMFDLPRYAENDPMEHCPLWTGRPEIREGKVLRKGFAMPLRLSN